MVKYASWIHGTAVQQRREGYFVSRERRPDGAKFMSTGEGEFSFPIPTPVIIDDKRASLTKIFLCFTTGGGAEITKVRVFDGKNEVKKFENLSLSGNHSHTLSASNSWDINPPLLVWRGLCIIVNVKFGNSTPTTVPDIVFKSAGADFNV